METIQADIMQPEGATGSDYLLSMEELIKNHVKSIDDLKLEIKKKNEMLEDSFNNDAAYRELTETAKGASKEKAKYKAQIMKAPDVARLAQEIKDLRFDMREKKKTTSDLLLDWREQTGATQLSLFDGDYELVQSVKLVKRSRK